MATELLVNALDLDKAGDWDAAHRVVQRLESVAASRIHAYLHRKEGDLGNANYWYARAGVEMPHCSLEAEWQKLRHELDA